MCEAPPLWPDRRDFFKRELSRLRTAKVAKVTRSVLFSLKCTRNRLAAGLRPDPLGELERSPSPPSRKKGGLLLRGGGAALLLNEDILPSAG